MHPDFQNTQNAYAHLSKRELKQAKFLFSFITKPFWVKTGKLFFSLARILKIPYAWAVKGNIFKHFCAGETIQSCSTTIQILAAHSCASILDYSAEGLAGEQNFELVKNEIIQTIHYAQENKNVRFGVFKFTGLCDRELLESVSLGKPVSAGDEMRWMQALSRVDAIFNVASKQKLPVFVDAEETWIQPALDHMAETMMLRYNQKEAIVFTTIQMYRKSSINQLNQLIEFARKNNIVAGVKLVRGAYMEKERIRARQMGYDSPIHLTKSDTDKAFNNAVTICLDNIEKIHVCIATHNEMSCAYATEVMELKGIIKDDQRIWFAQLFGMSDHITFNLAAAGYNTAKYLPYGPVKKVMPYLIRRAEENSSVADQSNRELSNLKKELKRRQEILHIKGK